jgi:hypothetical protein
MNSHNLNSKHQRYATTLVLKLAQWLRALPSNLPSSFTKSKEWQSMIASYEYLNKLHQDKQLSRTTARNFVDVKSALHDVRMDVDEDYENAYTSVVSHREAIIQQAIGSKHMRYGRRIQYLQDLHRDWGQLPPLMHLHERALWVRFKSAVKEAQRYETKTRQFEVADVEVAYEVKKHLLHEATLVSSECSKTEARQRLQNIEVHWQSLPKANIDVDNRLRAKLRDIQRAVEDRPDE